jgi:hypothetical protein
LLPSQEQRQQQAVLTTKKDEIVMTEYNKMCSLQECDNMQAMIANNVTKDQGLE